MLVNTLSLLFAFTAFIHWSEALLIGLALAALLYAITPAPEEAWEFREPKTLYFYLQWSWLGYVRLKEAFWPFFILYNGILLYIDYRIEEGAFTIASWVTMHIIMAMPLIYWTGAVWRCSDKCSARHWAIAARWILFATYVDLALRWVIYHDFPNILFNCQQMINHWGDCV